MPPTKKKSKASSAKQRKVDANDDGNPKHMWLLTYEYGGRYEEIERKIVLFSSKEKAIASMPTIMDNESPHGLDWRNGLKGFGREDKDNYLGYEYFGKTIGEDGVLIHNDIEGDNEPLSVCLELLPVDPAIKRKRQQEESDNTYEGVFF